MFALLVNNAVPGANNAWTNWIEHIMKQKDAFGIRKAAMVSKKGYPSANTPHFVLSGPEIQALNKVFSKRDREKVRLEDRTYVIRDLDERHLTAFNGSKHLIVAASKTMYVMIIMEGRRDKLDEGVAFMENLCKKLSAKNY